jgi:hypothetical protein
MTNIRRHSGIAGQFAVSAEVTYPGEPMRAVTFTGSNGGPVVMTTAETFVTDPGRFGKFGETWVRKFFEAA